MKKISTSLVIACGLFISGCEQKSSDVNLAEMPRNGACSIDVPANKSQLSAMADFHVGGWAFDKATNSTTNELIVYFKNTETNELSSVAAKTGHNRADVAKALNIAAIANSGFNAVMEKGALTAGTYEMVLVQTNKDKGAIICDNEPHLITIN